MLRVGLLGAGFMGRTHAQAWQRVQNAKLAIVAGVPVGDARELAAEMNCSFTDSLEEVVWRKDLDAADVCLPTYLHEEFVIAAMMGGKHVICEKPLTLSLESADRIFEAARQSGKVLMVAHVVRFWPEYRAAANLVRSGGLGKLLVLRAARSSCFPNWSSWFRDPQKSGGALFDLQIHDLDYAVSVLGRPRRVCSSGLKSAFGSWDYVSTQLDFDGSRAQLEASYMMPDSYPFTSDIMLLCENGVLEYRFRVAGNMEARETSSNRLVLICPGCLPSHPPVSEKDAYQAEIQDFVDSALAGRSSESVPNADVRVVLEVVSAIRESLDLGEPVWL
jgi:predicted dehydrogenase